MSNFQTNETYKTIFGVVKWLEMIWQTDLPANAKYIAAYLRTYMNDKSDVAWPSLGRIQRETGLSRSTVTKYLGVLESEGWIIRIRGDHKTTTRYHVHVPKTVIRKTFEDALNDNEPSSQDALGSARDGLLLVRETDYLVRETDPNIQDNKQVNNKQNNIQEFAQKQFARFYEKYPRKKDRAKAEKAFLRIAKKCKDQQHVKTFTDMLIRHIDKRRESSEWLEKEFIPYPSSFLNGERWLDEIDKKHFKTNNKHDMCQSTRDLSSAQLLTDTSWYNSPTSERENGVVLQLENKNVI